MIEEDKKVLININKKWSNRFHKMISLERDPYKANCNVIENADHEEIIPESGA